MIITWLVFSSADLVPEFSDGYPVNITVQRENTAFLDCPVKNPGDRPVSYPLVSFVSLISTESDRISCIRSPGSESETGISSPTGSSDSPQTIGSMFSTGRDPSTGFFRLATSYNVPVECDPKISALIGVLKGSKL